MNCNHVFTLVKVKIKGGTYQIRKQCEKCTYIHGSALTQKGINILSLPDSKKDISQTSKEIIPNAGTSIFKKLQAGSVNAQFAYLDTLYRRVFIDFKTMSRKIKDKQFIALNIDRLLYLKGDKVIRVHEIFYQNGTCLNIPTTGDTWIDKPIKFDFLVVVFINAEECFMIETGGLRTIWMENKTDWANMYKKRVGRKTFLAVPISQVTDKVYTNTSKLL